MQIELRTSGMHLSKLPLHAAAGCRMGVAIPAPKRPPERATMRETGGGLRPSPRRGSGLLGLHGFLDFG